MTSPTPTLPAPNLPDPSTADQRSAADGRPWSFTAFKRRQRCPRAWSYRYGPHADQMPDELRESVKTDLEARGNVLHDAVAAALIAAGVELATTHRRQPLPGVALSRYWAIARRELGAAWERYQMPADRHAAAETVQMLRDCLDAVPVPARKSIVGVELNREIVTPSGLPVRFIIDYAYWDAGRLVVCDWKSGGDDPDRVDSHAQLLCYAVWLAQDMGVDLERVDIRLHNLKYRRAVQVAVPVERARAVVAEFEQVAHAANTDPDPVTRPGPQCTGCFARRVCPEMAGHYAARV